MDNRELLKERCSLFQGALEFKDIKRVPSISNTYTWKIADSDLHPTMTEAMSNFDILKQVEVEHHVRYNFDTYNDLGLRNNFTVSKALGFAQHQINDEAFSLEVVDMGLIRDEDVDAYIEDSNMFVWTSVGPRFFSHLTYADLENAIKANQRFQAYAADIKSTMINDYGVPIMAQASALHPLDLFCNVGRGLKKVSTDFRRNPEKLLGVVASKGPGLRNMTAKALDLPGDEFAFGLRVSLLLHCLTNLKQFETFYFPFLKECIDVAIEKNKSTFIFAEASVVRFADYFNEFPKGTICIQSELDDLFDMRKSFPELAVCGGTDCVLLQYGTPQECADQVKNVLDTIGNGFVYSQNKMMSFKTDGNRTNMLAIKDVLDSYWG